jgi:hypothetical protein
MEVRLKMTAERTDTKEETKNREGYRTFPTEDGPQG